MESTSVEPPTADRLQAHGGWRPDWAPLRPCLYWYLTFSGDQVQQAVGDGLLPRLDGNAWLDVVPPEWSHITVTDVGFADDLESSDAAQVTAAVARAVAGHDRLSLTLGPLRTSHSAVVLDVQPLEPLREMQAVVRRSTTSALDGRHTDVHRGPFWPHLSLGYVNRPLSVAATTQFRSRLPEVVVRLEVEALTLAMVTRRGHGYDWKVQAQVPLGAVGAPTPPAAGRTS